MMKPRTIPRPQRARRRRRRPRNQFGRVTLGALSLLFFLLILGVATDARPRRAWLAEDTNVAPGLGMVRWLERYPLPANWDAVTLAPAPLADTASLQIEDSEASAVSAWELDASQLNARPVYLRSAEAYAPSWQSDASLEGTKVVNLDVPLLEWLGPRAGH